jgi:two-component system chemotaxis sensor kinase CheA
MAIDMSQFYQVFFDESAEHLAAMEGLLLDLDVENPDSEQLNAIFRAHSIKGSAGTSGSSILPTPHILENLLDRIRKQELGLRAEMVDAFLECGDLLRKCSKPIRGGAKSTAPWRPFVLACANCPPTRPVRLPYPGGGAPVAHGLPARGRGYSTSSSCRPRFPRRAMASGISWMN